MSLTIELTDITKLTDYELVRLLEYRVFSWPTLFDNFEDAADEIFELFKELRARAFERGGLYTPPSRSIGPDEYKNKPRSDNRFSDGLEVQNPKMPREPWK